MSRRARTSRQPAPAPHVYGAALRPAHAALLAASAIHPLVAAARGYRSITRAADLAALGFAPAQCRAPGLLVPLHDVEGHQPAYQFRPDTPRLRDGDPVKYETPAGGHVIVDVPPGARAALDDPHVPLWITEGARKADAAVSAGLCCVALLGVWNFRGTNAQGGQTLLPDWELIALRDRVVYVAFDSDAAQKPQVAAACARLSAVLGRRGAQVQVVRIPPGPGGAKVGLDDYLAAGGAVAALTAAATPAPAPAPAARAAAPSAPGRRAPAAHRLVRQAGAAGAHFFHSPEGFAYARVTAGDHEETWALDSAGFRFWLARSLYATEQRTPSTAVLDEAIAELTGTALYEGPAEPVHLRVAAHAGAFYLDLGDPTWRAVRITAAGWEVCACPPVHFVRPRGMGALPEPVPGRVDALWDFVNVTSDRDRALLLAFLVAALCPFGPYPLLLLTGEQGTAKSSLARIVRTLVDPTSSPLHAEPESVRDLMITALNNWVVTADNLSRLPVWLSNALCRLSTGGGISVRELYTNANQLVIAAERPVILTSIAEVVTRGDLLERALLLRLEPIPPAQRRPERELLAGFTAAAPGILGGLLDGVASGLRLGDTVVVPELPRMADFARWATACEPGLGRSLGSFLAAYDEDQRDSYLLVLERTPWALALYSWLRGQPDQTFSGSPTALHAVLSQYMPRKTLLRGNWPRSAAHLTGALNEIAPSLRRVGIEVRTGERAGHGGSRRVTLRLGAGAAALALPPLPAEAPAA